MDSTSGINKPPLCVSHCTLLVLLAKMNGFFKNLSFTSPLLAGGVYNGQRHPLESGGSWGEKMTQVELGEGVLGVGM